MKNYSCRLSSFLAVALSTGLLAGSAVAAEQAEEQPQELPVNMVIIEQDLVLPVIPAGDGSGVPVCVDVSGLLVADCDLAKGDKGDTGDPGNLALAGDVCPLGEFLAGFDGAGDIVCRAGPPFCGNELVDGIDACDDGNHVDGDGCSADCLSNETCGNSIVDFITGEECDAGGVNTAECDTDCTTAYCGDGFVNPVLEECDDGNNQGGDGCSASCVTEDF